ncbi:hypothetical protein KQX54_004864 [Cotesia glomerata]|uniref:Uncharacterized protein n=1 Tax=Cotesia glomerata TaxID=32391 RepID=A0AAV7I081_COTGL|nr:hypothetical protein KQX54_004864 [Cotesia glomerata]
MAFQGKSQLNSDGESGRARALTPSTKSSQMQTLSSILDPPSWSPHTVWLDFPHTHTKDAGRIGDEMKHAACVVAVSRLRGPAFNPWCPPVATSPCTPFPVILSTSSLRLRFPS